MFVVTQHTKHSVLLFRLEARISVGVKARKVIALKVELGLWYRYISTSKGKSKVVTVLFLN
jgi:hypothetical protein